MLDPQALAALRDERLDWRFKAIPPPAHGRTLAAWLADRPHLSDLGTPLMTLDAAALDHDITVMAAWFAAAGVRHAPHGKTTMAPALWERQLRAGAYAITLANAPQLRVARTFGVPRVLLANQLLDPAALRWLAAWAAEGAWIRVQADSVDGVALMDDALRGAPAPLDVLVEIGAAGGRAGARGLAAAREVAEAVARSPRLRLAGVSAWEGGVAHDDSPADLAAADRLLADLRALHDAVPYETDAPIVTAGGSAYFDQVLAHLADVPGGQVVVRSGSYVTHDDGTYTDLSPASRGRPGPALAPALRAHARVLSRPEHGLALLDAGRRDLPFDAGLPVPLDLPGAAVTDVNDQHAYLTGDLGALRPGDLVRLGVSHPCTAFDKWTLIPVLDAEGTVVDAVRTYF